MDPKGGKIIAQLRSSYGFLKENTERHKKGYLKTFCQHCYKGEETVEHFLIHCKMYDKDREEFWASINTKKIEGNFLLNTLLGKDLNKEWSIAISNFLKRISAKRERIAFWGG